MTKGVKPKSTKVGKYLQEGEVTQITPQVKEIANQILGEGKEFVENLLRWLEKSSYYKKIPEDDEKRLLDTEHLQRTADQILKSGYTIACGEQAIIFMALCRAKGIPVKYVEAVSLDWLRQESDKNMHSHAFVETYLDGKWVLVDPARRKIYDEIDYEKRGFVKWVEGIDFRDLKDKKGKRYSWKNLDILKKETLAFKRRWKKQNPPTSGKFNLPFPKISLRKILGNLRKLSYSFTSHCTKKLGNGS